jgi:Mg-chelatase subunit ChlD
MNRTVFAVDAFVSIRARAVEGVHFIITSSAIHTRMTVAFIYFYKQSNKAPHKGE